MASVNSLTVGEYLQSWLDGKRKLRDTTRRNYATHIRRYLVPSLGRTRLTDLRPHHIDSLYTDLLSGLYAGASSVTVQHVHRTLRSALNTTVKRRLIPWNPALHLELPEHHRPRTQVWEASELTRFLESTVEERLYALFHLIAFTGMRRGEALGLHWSDVDLERAEVAVAFQVTDAGNGPLITRPKTEAGVRIVPIDPLTVRVLARQRIEQAVERSAWGDAG